MSAREAKGRMLSREYMADRLWMTDYSPAEREWYLLTSLFADDAGYLEWDLAENAANLYRYMTPRRRESLVAGYVAHFERTGKLHVLDCGHAHMPGVAKHPRGRSREYSVRDQHTQCTVSALTVQCECTSLLSVPIRSYPIRSVPALGDGSKEPDGRTKKKPEPIGSALSDEMRKRGIEPPFGGGKS